MQSDKPELLDISITACARRNGGVGVDQLKELKRPQKDETPFIEGITILFHAKF